MGDFIWESIYGIKLRAFLQSLCPVVSRGHPATPVYSGEEGV